MKRDMELVREMLFAIEDGGGWFPGADSLKIEGRDEDNIRYHLAILVDADIVHRETMTVYKGRGLSAVKISDRPGSYRMTWAGHDFLDTVRDPEVWKRTKSGASKLGGLAFGAFKDMATAYAKHVAKERLGLDL